MSEAVIPQAVRLALQDYFLKLEGVCPSGLYSIIRKQVEKAMLEVVMEKASGNQSKAARWLGISRGKLISLLAKYKL